MADVTPLGRTDVQLAEHGYQNFSAVTKTVLTKKQLVEPALWANCAQKMRMGSEIRVIDENVSYMARLFVIYQNSHDIRVRVLEYHVFEEEKSSNQPEAEYSIKQRGVHKWCIMRKGHSDPIHKDIPSKLEAEVKLNDYLKALRK